MNKIFKTDEFAVQIVSMGAFVDDDPGFDGKSYIVETAVVRLNHVAMNEWVFAAVHNCRECYETDQEWKDYLAKKEDLRRAFEGKLAAAVDFHPENGSICITQAVSEVFTIVHIHEA